jgi:hypothetical protein
MLQKEGMVADDNSKNSTHSSLRESIVEHLFVGEVLRLLWCQDKFKVEILKPQVDNAGYDLAIACNSTLWHVQLKSCNEDGKRSSVNVGLELTKKRNWCVIWIFVDKDLGFKSFRWFGSDSGQFVEGDFKPTKHTKGNATGHKAERPGYREVPRSKFEKLTKDQVIQRLFDVSPG